MKLAFSPLDHRGYAFAADRDLDRDLANTNLQSVSHDRIAWHAICLLCQRISEIGNDFIQP